MKKEETELYAVRKDEIGEIRLGATEHVNTALHDALLMCRQLAKTLAKSQDICDISDSPPVR